MLSIGVRFKPLIRQQGPGEKTAVISQVPHAPTFFIPHYSMQAGQIAIICNEMSAVEAPGWR